MRIQARVQSGKRPAPISGAHVVEQPSEDAEDERARVVGVGAVPNRLVDLVDLDAF